ncbi:MAG: nucleoside hydrolase [Erysipelotrichaceae bacterium]
MEKKHKVIIDCDPGVDDALAINALFMAENVDVLLISIVGGNRPLEVVYKNGLRLARFFNRDVKIAKGSQPLSVCDQVSTSYFHGENGLGGVELPYSEDQLIKENSVDAMAQILKENPDEVEIVALGPLTNLALLAQKYPSQFQSIKAIYSMGGTFSVGNITPYCEFNYYFDLKATEIVLNQVVNEGVQFHMFPLDVTKQVAFDMNEFTFLRFEGGKWGNLIADMFEKNYLVNSYKFIGKPICVLHDLLCAMYLLDSSDFDQVESSIVTVNMQKQRYGQLIQQEGKSSLYVHKKVDGYNLKKKFLALNYEHRIIEKYEFMMKGRI